MTFTEVLNQIWKVVSVFLGIFSTLITVTLIILRKNISNEIALKLSTSTESLDEKLNNKIVESCNTIYDKMLEVTDKLENRQTDSEKQIAVVVARLDSLDGNVSAINSTISKMNDKIGDIWKVLVERGK